MSFVGVPQACESIAIDLGVLAGKLREYAQALRRNDLESTNVGEHARALSKRARADLDELLAIMPPEPEKEPKKRKSK